MWVHITRGLGGRKGVIILIVTAVVGLVFLFLAHRARQRLLAPKGVVVAELPREEVLALGEKARGPMNEVLYAANDMARVAMFAVAKRDDGRWEGLARGTILQVTGTQIEGADTWVHALIQGGTRREMVTVHASFLERYLPVVLDKTIEISDLRLLQAEKGPKPGHAVTGWLRNITSETISQCVVACVFQDNKDREVGTLRTGDLVLRPKELVRFQTAMFGRPFASISIQITHATPDGLRNYLSTIVIQHSAME